jgi:SAM-dependent methyltransferase
VGKLEALEAKYLKLKAQRDALKRQRDHLKSQLALARAPLEAVQREKDKQRALQHRQQSKLPIPPEALRLRVHGTADEIAFLAFGDAIASGVKQILIAEARPLESFQRILDFGCGCGRVIRFFEEVAKSCELFATDIDLEAISWCQENLKGLATFNRNHDEPPLDFAPDSFDIILAISVFTHLPESLEQAWLGELKRIARPGAILLLSVHGQRCFWNVPSASYDELDRRGFCYAPCGATEGLPDYYQTSFHSETYIREHWSKFFYLRRIVALGSQDVVVCQK